MTQRALISVFDKRGLEDLMPVLSKYNVQIISSGGTARKIKELGYEVTEVSDYTGYPESPDGLVKTLQPKIHGGLLLNPDNPAHKAYMDQQGIEPIDLVVVNLYPFENVVKRLDVELLEAVENIDIGGPTMIRSAAKAALLYERTAIVIDPSMYPSVIEELEKNNGSLTKDFIRTLAIAAFDRTFSYDGAILNYLRKG